LSRLVSLVVLVLSLWLISIIVLILVVMLLSFHWRRHDGWRTHERLHHWLLHHVWRWIWHRVLRRLWHHELVLLLRR
jgi:hypothetical protein